MKAYVSRSGRINVLWVMLLGAGAAIVVLVLLLNTGGPGRGDKAAKLAVYCAAGVRVPMDEIARRYEQEYGVKVELQYGGSNTLLNQIEVNKFDTGDLYLAADDFYTDLACEKGLAAETLPIAHMRPVITVRKDSEKKIETLEDLLADDVTVVVANPDQAAIGRAIRERLAAITVGDSNRWQQLEEHVTNHGVFKPTVTDVASDVKLGSVDAGIVFDSTVAMPKFRDELKAVPVPELEGDPNLVTVSVLNSSRQPTAALKFARYVTARDRGLPVFEEYGFRPVEGDVWVERPEITFFCGAVNRRAVDQIIVDFQQREDVSVNTIYDGCGILTSRMKTIDGQSQDKGFPDVYMACDVYYLENVKQWFQEAANVSDTEIVIAVPKGSTKVKELGDLLEPGVRVAVGEPDQCTIGALTRRLLVKEGIYDRLKEKQQQEGEVVVEKSSSALLVPDVVTGHVDAAVAYITDVLANRDSVDIVRIASPMNMAIQPFSIAKTSDHKYLVRRLFRRIADSPEAFEDIGFHFRLNQDVDKEKSEATSS
jgi:molybdenum ABC transporter molybdate-binding protein